MEKIRYISGASVVATAVGLLIYGVSVAPPGVIDETVIKAVGVCFAFAAATLGVEIKIPIKSN